MSLFPDFKFSSGELLLALVASVLLSLGLAPFSQAWTGWVALTPLAIAIFIGRPSLFRAFYLGWIALLFHHLASLIWLCHVTVLGWMALCAYLGLYGGIWAIFLSMYFQWIRPDEESDGLDPSKSLLVAIFGSCGWVLLEWVRSWMITGFPWNYLGVTQVSWLPMCQIAEWGGVFAVSWVVCFFSIVLACVILRLKSSIRSNLTKVPRWDIQVALVVMVMVAAWGMIRVKQIDSDKVISVAVVQPDIPQRHDMAADLRMTLTRCIELSEKALIEARGAIDLIVWPETPVSEALFSSHYFLNTIARFTEESGVPLILGSNDEIYPHTYNAAFYLDSKKFQQEVYYKNHLVLFGEYVPGIETYPWLKRFSPLYSNYRAGDKIETFDYKDGMLQVAPLICFEDTLPDLARKWAQLRPQLFINITNGGWFQRSVQQWQHLNNARFRAIENRIPLVRSTNNGVSGTVDARGVLIDWVGRESGDIHSKGFKVLQVAYNQNSKPTLYSLYGNAWLWGCFGVWLCLLYAAKRLQGRA